MKIDFRGSPLTTLFQQETYEKYSSGIFLTKYLKQDLVQYQHGQHFLEK